MPNVTSQNLFAVLPSMINIIRGQATSAKVTLHKNYVGNPLPIALQSNVMVEYIDGDNVVFKTESTALQNLIYGTGELNNQMSIELSSAESAALNLSETGVSGEFYIRISITQASSTKADSVELLDLAVSSGDARVRSFLRWGNESLGTRLG